MRRWGLPCLAVLVLCFCAVAFAFSGIGATPSSLSFEQGIADGPSAEQTSIVKNVGIDRTIQTVTVGGGDAGDFEVLSGGANDCSDGPTLTNNGTCDVRVRFDPTTTGLKNATVNVQTDDPNPGGATSITLDGNATERELSADPTSLDLGDQSVAAGASDPKTSTITNSGTGPVTLSATNSLTIGGTDSADFHLQTGAPNDCSDGQVLAVNETCDVRVDFDPSNTGAKTAHVTVASDADPVQVDLGGNGTEPALSLSQSTLDFTQDIDEDASSPEVSTVTNTGSEAVQIFGVNIGGSDSGDFTQLTNQGSDCVAGTLPVGATCDVRIVFDPSTFGTKSGTATVVSTAPDQVITLNGHATQTLATMSTSLFDYGKQDIDAGATAADGPVFTNSGSEPITISGIDVSGTDAADFSPDAFAPGDCTNGLTLDGGDTCALRYTFDPATVGDKLATVTVSSNADPVSADLTGTGSQTELSGAPTSQDFGEQDVDDGPTTPPKTSVITNTGTEDVTISGIDFSSPEYSRVTPAITGDCTPGLVLHANDTCNLRMQFDPSATGDNQTATAEVSSNADPVDIDLTGDGVDTALSSSPTSISFGDQDIDGTAEQDAVITNAGTQTVDVSGIHITGADAGSYALLGGDAGDCSTKGSIAAGETCDARVSFQPATTGTKLATVQVPGRPEADIPLDGTGIQTELTPSPTSLSFGDQETGAGPSAAKDTTITNSGTEDVTLTSIGVTGDFAQTTGAGTNCANGTTLAAGESCEVWVEFEPTARGSRLGAVTVSSNAPDATVGLDGNGVHHDLTASPNPLAFDPQDVDTGTPQTLTSTVQNTGDDPVHVSGVSIVGAADYTLATPSQTGDCGASTTLNAGDTCDVRVKFDAADIHTRTATVHVASAELPDETIGLTGDGFQTELTPSPTSSSFGSQDIAAGPTSPNTIAITNTGTETVTLSSIAITGDQRGQFKRVTGGPSDCTNASSLAEGDSCNVQVAFDPSWSGPKTATLKVASNAPDVTVALDGTGTQATFGRSDAPLEGYAFDGPVNALAYDSAGRTYVGGAFTDIGPRTGRGVKLSDASDQPAAGFPDVDGTIDATIPDGSGGWYIGGSFADVGGVARSNLAHLQSSGALDTTWNPAPDGPVNALALSGSDLYVGGDFINVGGAARTHIAKLATTGTGVADAGWIGDANGTVRTIAVAGSRVFAGGTFTTIGGQPRNRIASLLTSTGDADPGFDPSANGTVNTLLVSGTDLYAGGSFTRFGPAAPGGTPRNRIAKLLLADGSVESWNPGADGDVNALLESGTDLYAGGAFANIGSQPRNRIARLAESDGTVASWDPNANGTVNTLGQSPAGVYAGGAFTVIDSQPRDRIARLSGTTGHSDAGWNPDANGTVNSIAVAGTDLYVGGSFTSVGAQIPRSRLARLLPDGTIDPDWAPIANNTVNALVVSGTDVYVGGQFTVRRRPGPQPDRPPDNQHGWRCRHAVEPGCRRDRERARPVRHRPVRRRRVHHDGSTSAEQARQGGDGHRGNGGSELGAKRAGRVGARAGRSGDGRVRGRQLPEHRRHRAVVHRQAGHQRLDPARPDLGPERRQPGAGTRGSIAGHLFVGGDFSTIGGQTRNHLARLSPSTGQADIAWDPNANGTGVRALTITGSDIYAGGDFTLVGGVSHNRVVRLPTEDGGANDSDWNPIANGTVNALASTATRLAVGGAFTTVNGQSRQGVALFDLPRLDRNPSGQQFGSQDTGDGPTATQTTTVTNSGATSVTFSALTLGGTDAGDFQRLTGGGSDCTASTTLVPGGSCDVRVQFDPTTTGLKSAWVEIDAPAMPEATFGLAGTGTHTELTRSPTTLSFGSVDIDDSPPAGGPFADRTSTATNSGSVPITISGVTIAQTGTDFTRLTGDPGDCFDGRVLDAGQSCDVRIRFNPSATGQQTPTATIHSTPGTCRSRSTAPARRPPSRTAWTRSTSAARTSTTRPRPTSRRSPTPARSHCTSTPRT